VLHGLTTMPRTNTVLHGLTNTVLHGGKFSHAPPHQCLQWTTLSEGGIVFAKTIARENG